MQKKQCDGDGIIWIDPPKVESLVVCNGCRVCREVQRRRIKKSKPFTKKETKCLVSGGFKRKECFKITLRKLLRLERKCSSNLVSFLETCLNIYDAAKTLQTM